MIGYVLRMQGRLARASWETFGASREFLLHALARPCALAVGAALFRLDAVFFPGCRRAAVVKPLFIVGNPRSGTTFLHRLLTQTDAFSVFRLWEIAIPSLAARKLLWPLIRRRLRRQAAILTGESGHEIRLDSIEEEEHLFHHVCNGQTTADLTPLAFGDWDFRELVHFEEQPECVRRATMRFFRGCLQRQVHALGRPQVVAKTCGTGMRLRALLAEFPDARIVYLLRSPLDAIPSHLSLNRQAFDRLYGLDRIPPPRLQRYFERRYRYDVDFYLHMEQVLAAGVVPASQMLVLPYERLRTDLAGAVDDVLRFAGIRIGDDLRARIAREAAAQPAYRPAHRNLSLEDFGLSTEQLLRDLAPVFAKYGFPVQPRRPQAGPEGERA